MTKLSIFVVLLVVSCVYVTGFVFGFIDNKMLRNFINDELGYSVNVLPIENVRVEAPFGYTNENQIKNILIEAGIEDANFFNISMKNIIKYLEHNPWIKDIQLTRVWPNKLNLKYNENTPLAYFNNDKVIIKDNCQVVSLSDIAAGTLRSEQLLPFLVGNEKNIQKLCDTLEKIEIYVKPINNRIKKIVFSKRNSIYLELENGVTVLLGRNDTLERFQRFVSFVSKKGFENLTVSKDAKTDHPYVDMRYYNGLAVGNSKGIDLTELMETA